MSDSIPIKSNILKNLKIYSVHQQCNLAVMHFALHLGAHWTHFFKALCVIFHTHTDTHTHHPYVFTLIGGPGLSMKFFKGLLFAALKFLSSVFRVKWNMAVWKAFVKQIPPHWIHFNDTFHMQSKILKYVCSCKRKEVCFSVICFSYGAQKHERTSVEFQWTLAVT